MDCLTGSLAIKTRVPLRVCIFVPWTKNILPCGAISEVKLIDVNRQLPVNVRWPLRRFQCCSRGTDCSVSSVPPTRLRLFLSLREYTTVHTSLTWWGRQADGPKRSRMSCCLKCKMALCSRGIRILPLLRAGCALTRHADRHRLSAGTSWYVFFVRKSRRRLRLILHVRRWNAQFLAPPPGVRLLSSEGFGRIEVALPANVKVKSEMGRNQLDEFAIAISTTDVRDCFHRFLMSRSLVRSQHTYSQ